MKFPKLSVCALIMAGATACGTSTSTSTTSTETESVEQCSAADEPAPDTAADSELIIAAYDKFVFAADYGDTVKPEDYFTANALRKLQDAYEYDCESGTCYAFWALRTGAQDSKPGTDEVSQITTIDPAADGWYIVSYTDMGWPGKTLIKMTDGKIDDYESVTE